MDITDHTAYIAGSIQKLLKKHAREYLAREAGVRDHKDAGSQQHDLNDLKQGAWLAAVEAIAALNGERLNPDGTKRPAVVLSENTRITTYLFAALENSILFNVRFLKGYKPKTQPTFEALYDKEGEAREDINPLHENTMPEEPSYDRDFWQNVSNLTSAVEAQGAVVLMIWRDGLKPQEIASKLGLTAKRVSKLGELGLRRLKKESNNVS